MAVLSILKITAGYRKTYIPLLLQEFVNKTHSALTGNWRHLAHVHFGRQEVREILLTNVSFGCF